MAYDQDLISNLATLARFDDLQENNKMPTIAIYRGRTLTITSYKADNFLGKIYQIFLKIQNFIYSIFGLLDYDSGKIDAIKDKVAKYHYDKCANLRANDTKLKDDEKETVVKEKTALHEENVKIAELSKILKAEKEELAKANASLKEEVEKLQESNLAEENKKIAEDLNKLTTEYNDLVDEYTGAETLVEAYKKKNADLTEQNKTHTASLRDMLNVKKTYNNEVTSLKVENQNLSDEVTKLKNENKTLESRLGVFSKTLKEGISEGIALMENSKQTTPVQNNNNETSIDELKKENDVLKNEIEELNDENKTLRKKCEALQDKINFIGTEIKISAGLEDLKNDDAFETNDELTG